MAEKNQATALAAAENTAFTVEVNAKNQAVGYRWPRRTRRPLAVARRTRIHAGMPRTRQRVIGGEEPGDLAVAEKNTAFTVEVNAKNQAVGLSVAEKNQATALAVAGRTTTGPGSWLATMP